MDGTWLFFFHGKKKMGFLWNGIQGRWNILTAVLASLVLRDKALSLTEWARQQATLGSRFMVLMGKN